MTHVINHYILYSSDFMQQRTVISFEVLVLPYPSAAPCSTAWLHGSGSLPAPAGTARWWIEPGPEVLTKMVDLTMRNSRFIDFI